MQAGEIRCGGIPEGLAPMHPGSRNLERETGIEPATLCLEGRGPFFSVGEPLRT